MPESFEFRDMSESEFWGVDLQRSKFRDVDLSGSRIAQARLVDVEIDADIDRLIVNGVDVTEFVHERDPWYTLRSQMFPTDPVRMRDGWREFVAVWERAIARAATMPEQLLHESVGGEWSFVQTMQHLVMATDKWWTAPVSGGTFAAIGLPNSGSRDVGWPNIDLGAAPTFDEAVEVWRGRADALRRYLADVDPAEVLRQVEVIENGTAAVHDCIGVVFEEHFQHLRYALRDLDALLR